MRDFKRNNSFGGRERSFGKNRGFGNRGERPTLYKTQCSKCGKECEVPFRPTGEKPVFCRECFREMGGNEKRRSNDRNFSRPPFQNTQHTPSDNQYKEQLAKVNEKLDAILRILNAPDVPHVAPEQEGKISEQLQESIGEEKKKKAVKNPS